MRFQRFGFSEHAYSPNATHVSIIAFVVNGKWHGLQICNAHALNFSIRSYSCTQLAWLQCRSELSIHTEVCTSKNNSQNASLGPTIWKVLMVRAMDVKMHVTCPRCEPGHHSRSFTLLFAILACAPECVCFKNCSKPEPRAHRDNTVKNQISGSKREPHARRKSRAQPQAAELLSVEAAVLKGVRRWRNRDRAGPDRTPPLRG